MFMTKVINIVCEAIALGLYACIFYENQNLDMSKKRN